MTRDRQQAALDRLRAKGNHLAPFMVDGKVRPKQVAPRPAQAATTAPQAPGKVITPERAPGRSTGHTGPGEFTLWIPAPDDFLNLNHRQNHFAKARRVKAWRETARDEARRQLMPKHWGRVHVLFEPVKATGRAYDVHNLVPTAKAVIDGLVDYQVVIDDSNEFLTGPDMRPGGTGKPGVYVVIRQLPGAHDMTA